MRIRPVPVSISYEFDPCAPFKARGVSITERDGAYTKRPDEDVRSIAMGIMGWKGRVHLHFGEPITDIPETPQALASIIDRQIILRTTGYSIPDVLCGRRTPESLLVAR